MSRSRGERHRAREARRIATDGSAPLRYYGGNAQWWVDMQSVYDLKMAEKSAAKQI
jgi:plasmid maintenance system antidote protein VapI